MNKIQIVRLSELKVNQSILALNSKMKKYISKLKRHIIQNGIVEPLIVDQESKLVLDGQLRYQILLSLGFKGVAVVFVTTHTIHQQSNKISKLKLA